MANLNQKKLENEFPLRQQNIGWESKVQVKKKTAYLSMSRLVFVGSCLNPGQTLYSYLAEDHLGRKLVMIYLDGNPRSDGETTQQFRYNTFLQSSSKAWKVKEAK